MLEGKLGLVVCVLIVTTAARAKVRAGRRDAFGGWDDDFLGFGGGVTLLVFDDADASLFAGEGEGDKDGFASVRARKAPP